MATSLVCRIFRTLRPAQPHRVRESAFIDASTSLYNRDGLLLHGKDLLARCRGNGRALSLAVFDCSDLLEVREIYGSRTARMLIDRIVTRLTALAGDRGLAARTGAAQFTVAIPRDREKALQAIHRILGKPTRIELDANDSEIVLVPDFVVKAVPEGCSVEQLHAALCRDLSGLRQQEQRRQRYLQHERERHTRPMSLQPVAHEPVARQAAPARLPRLSPVPVLPQYPSTMSVPLAAH